MSVRDLVREMVPHFEHDPEWLAMGAKWRGLMRTFNTATDRLAGIGPKKRKKSANPSTTEDNRET